MTVPVENTKSAFAFFTVVFVNGRYQQGRATQIFDRSYLIIIIIIIIITCTLIDVAIPADRNGVQKEAENKLKYKSLCIEIQRMWNLKCTIVPVIIGATGIVTRSLKKNLETVPGKQSIDSLQKTAILGTSHLVRNVLRCEA